MSGNVNEDLNIFNCWRKQRTAIKTFIAATFIATTQKERIVAFPRQNG